MRTCDRLQTWDARLYDQTPFKKYNDGLYFMSIWGPNVVHGRCKPVSTRRSIYAFLGSQPVNSQQFMRMKPTIFKGSNVDGSVCYRSAPVHEL
jgi:hypothetical protein